MMKCFIFRHSFLIFAMLALISCSSGEKEAKSTDSTVIGEYIGRYYDGYETLEMRKDFTFKQTFKKPGVVVYSFEGKWQFQPPGTINFSPFISLIDFSSTGGVEVGKPNRTDGMSAAFRRDPDRIELGDWPYILTKSNLTHQP